LGASDVVTVTAGNAPADLVALSIVLVGPFDPRILQPANLVTNGLLEAGDVEGLRLPWIQVVVEPNKLTALTTLESPIGEPVRDFVVSLHETRTIKTIGSLGLNHEAHYAVSSEDVWHRVGHTLAPKENVWNRVLTEPGMLILGIRAKRDDEWGGNINVRVEPSNRIRPGIYVNVNDHFEAKDQGSSELGNLIDVLSDDWASSRARFDRIVVAVKELSA
jgi:hypothetical protein